MSKDNENRCRYCGKKLNGLTPCNCGGKEKYTIKLWDREKRRYERRKNKNE